MTLRDKPGKKSVQNHFSGQPTITGKMVMKMILIHFPNC